MTEPTPKPSFEELLRLFERVCFERGVLRECKGDPTHKNCDEWRASSDKKRDEAYESLLAAHAVVREELEVTKLALQHACAECGSDDPELDANCPYRALKAELEKTQAELAEARDAIREQPHGSGRHITAKRYEDFIASKAITASSRGIETMPKLKPHLFPFQKHCVEFALRAGSAGLFLSTGLGKTACELEWAIHAAAQSNGSALILTPLAVARQIETEGK